MITIQLAAYLCRKRPNSSVEDFKRVKDLLQILGATVEVPRVCAGKSGWRLHFPHRNLHHFAAGLKIQLKSPVGGFKQQFIQAHMGKPKKEELMNKHLVTITIDTIEQPNVGEVRQLVQDRGGKIASEIRSANYETVVLDIVFPTEASSTSFLRAYQNYTSNTAASHVRVTRDSMETARTNFEMVSAMNTAFGNARGNPLAIDGDAVRRQCANIFDEFVELQKAMGLREPHVNFLKKISEIIKSYITGNQYDDSKFVLDDVRDALCDINVFSYGAHHRMGINADLDMAEVVTKVMTRFVKSPEDLEATVKMHSAKGVVHTYAEGEYPTMVLKSGSDQPDAPKGKFLKSVSTQQPEFYVPSKMFNQSADVPVTANGLIVRDAEPVSESLRKWLERATIVYNEAVCIETIVEGLEADALFANSTAVEGLKREPESKPVVISDRSFGYDSGEFSGGSDSSSSSSSDSGSYSD